MRTTTRRSLVAMAGVTAGLASVLTATPAQAAPATQQAAPDQAPAVPEAALAADVCWSWTDYVTGPGTPYNVYIPSTTRNGNQANCVLYNGISSEGVYKLQDALNRCYGRGLAKDGVFGGATERAVRYVQERHRITVDGVYGPNTRAAMTWPKYRNGAFNHC